MLFIVLVAFAGCVTSRVEYVEGENLPKEKVYRISVLYLNDGTVLNVKDKDAKLSLNKNNSSYSIIFFEDVNVEKSVSLQDIDKLKIEIMKSNTVLSVLVIAGSVILFFLLLILITDPLKGFRIG